MDWSAKNSKPCPWFYTGFDIPLSPLPQHVTVCDPDLVHHLKTVMRMKLGEAMVLVHREQASAFYASLDTVSHTQIGVTLQQPVEAVHDNKQVSLVAIVSILKAQHWDWMLQKLTELGVSWIIPFQAERSVVDIKDPLHKHQRWMQIIMQAAAQSEQVKLPQLATPMNITTLVPFIETLAPAVKLIATERDGVPLGDFFKVLTPPSPLQPITMGMAIGPEGGWTEAEKTAFNQAGFQLVSFGARIFRSDTAALYAASVLPYAYTHR